MTTILCDADVFAYRASIVHQNLTERRPGCFTLYANGNHANKQLTEQIKALMDTLEADRIIMALSDKKNFRKKILKSYKAHRAYTSKPLALEYVRSHICNNYETIMLPQLEGDDVIGILATGTDYIEGPKVIASIDKDFFTIPGVYFNLDKGTYSTTTEAEANYYHMYQTLIGDGCDGYKGCPKIGPVNAKIILGDSTASVPWGAIVYEYERKGLTPYDALVQARCARILRASDYDWTTREIKLWEPNK